MRFIKLALLSVFILSVLIMAASFLFPSHIIISRAVNVHAPNDTVLHYVKDIYAWKQWIEGMNDTSVNIRSSAEASIGGTKVVIQKIQPDKIVSNWVNKDGRVLISTINLIPDTLGEITIVQWQFDQYLKWYPWEKFGSMMSDKILGTMMEKNLDKLRRLAEKDNSPATTTEN